MKALHRVFTLAALLVLTSCAIVGGKKQQDRINASLINGYQLTGTITRDGEGRELQKSILDYDTDSNSYTWTGVDTSGAVRYRDTWFYDKNGRVTKVEARSASGDLIYTDKYVIKYGLLMKRKSSTGRDIAFTYNNKGVIATRTRSEVANGRKTVSVAYRHDENGNIAGAIQSNYKYEGDQLSSVSSITSAFEHDDAGKLVTTVVSELSSVTEIIRYEYDEHGNNTKRTTYDPDGNVVSTKSYTYAPSGKRIVNHGLSTLRFFP